MTTAIYHPFQEAGLGEAPFALVGVIAMPSPSLAEANVDAYNHAVRAAAEAARSFGVNLCSCEFCGMALVNNFIIRDRRGRHAVVGCDCVAKTGDAVLMEAAEIERKRHEKKLRAERAARARDARAAQFQAELDAQRSRNGGLTDREVAIAQEEAARRAKAEAAAEQNAWLIEVLAQVPTNGDFLPSVIRDLRRFKAADTLSDRACNILADIYAKQVSGKRRGEAYVKALNEFWSRLEA